jgi:hypothetical protein
MRASRTWTLVLLTLLVAVGGVLRGYDLAAAGLSEDEVNKLEAARGYLSGDFSQNREHPMMMKLQIAACLVVTDAWNSRVGDSARIPEEVPVRLPNVIFGALTAVVLFFFAEQYFGTAVGLTTAALWATGISAIAINRIAKEDTLLVFFYWASLYFYERAKRFGASRTCAQARMYGLAGASLGLMLASKYFPHYWGLLFLFYHFVGRNETNQPLTRRDYVWFYGAFAACFLLFNPTALLPSTLQYFAAYTDEQTITHHGYMLMGKIYPNNFSATPGGLPIYFYPLLLAVKTPFAVLGAFAIGLAVSVRRRSQTGWLFLLFMLVLWIIPFSIFAAKFMRYVLSILPVVYMLAAIGVVETYRFLAPRIAFGDVRRAVLTSTLACLVVVGPIADAAAIAPNYSLALNPLGRGRTGWFFPHDEFYDAGLREAIAWICRDAPPNAVVYGEAPPVFAYYQRRFGRPDLRFRQLSATGTAADLESPDYVVVQNGRIYFENIGYVRELEASRPPAETILVAGAEAARVYRTSDATVLEGAG